MSMSISTEEDEISKGEASKFFEGLERFTLIERGTGEVAAKRIDEIAKKDFARARIEAGLVLPRAGVSKLIKLGRPAVPPGRLVAVVKELCGVRVGEPEDAEPPGEEDEA